MTVTTTTTKPWFWLPKVGELYEVARSIVGPPSVFWMITNVERWTEKTSEKGWCRVTFLTHKEKIRFFEGPIKEESTYWIENFKRVR